MKTLVLKILQLESEQKKMELGTDEKWRTEVLNCLGRHTKKKNWMQGSICFNCLESCCQQPVFLRYLLLVRLLLKIPAMIADLPSISRTDSGHHLSAAVTKFKLSFFF